MMKRFSTLYPDLARRLTGRFPPWNFAPTDKAQLGIHAKRLLDDPVMQLAFERVAEGLVATWRKSGAADQEGREIAYRMLWALQAVQDKLRGFTGNNTLVAAELRRKEAESELNKHR